MLDLDSREYDLDSIEIDPRFKICQREMLLSLAVQIAYMIAMLAATFLLGRGPSNEYNYVAGLPAWWFWAIVITLFFTAIVIYITKFVFKDFSLTDD